METGQNDSSQHFEEKQGEAGTAEELNGQQDSNAEAGEKQQSLLQRLREQYPEKDVAFIAVDQLEDEAQIQEFFDDYVKWIGENENIKEHPLVIALKNISYIIGNHSGETSDLWRKALPDINRL